MSLHKWLTRVYLRIVINQKRELPKIAEKAVTDLIDSKKGNKRNQVSDQSTRHKTAIGKYATITGNKKST